MISTVSSSWKHWWYLILASRGDRLLKNFNENLTIIIIIVVEAYKWRMQIQRKPDFISVDVLPKLLLSYISMGKVALICFRILKTGVHQQLSLQIMKKMS